MSILFSVAMRKASLTLSLEMTLKYVKDAGALVVCFTGKIHLDVEDHVASYLLKTNRIRSLSIPNCPWCVTLMHGPCDLDLQHLLIDCFVQEIGVSSIVNFKSFFYRLW